MKFIKLSPEQIAEFRQAMQQVKPLLSKTPSIAKPLPPLRSPIIKKMPEPFLEKLSAHATNIEKVQADDTISFTKAGLQHKILRKLRRGEVTPEASLDLHAMTVKEAQHALSHFMQRCKQQDYRWVKIIHGKSRQDSPILKNQLNVWLRNLAMILAFHSAPRNDGGTGALYVLLKNQNKDKYHE